MTLACPGADLVSTHSDRRYLSTYYTEVETPKRASDGYENAPTLVGIADVFINTLGYVWNAKVR